MSYFYKKLENPAVYDLKRKIGKVLTWGKSPTKEYLLKQIVLQEGERILDVGCGTGNYSLFSEKYIGVDINEEYVEHAKNNYPGTFLAMDAVSLDFPDEHFDYVFSISLFHHIDDGQVEKAISEMKRVCKKDGRILILDAVFPNRLNFLGYCLFKLDRGKYTRTFNQLKGLLLKHDFKISAKDIGGNFLYRVAAFCYQK